MRSGYNLKATSAFKYVECTDKLMLTALNAIFHLHDSDPNMGTYHLQL